MFAVALFLSITQNIIELLVFYFAGKPWPIYGPFHHVSFSMMELCD